MAKTYQDTTDLILSAYSVKWNSNDLGWVDKVEPKIELITKEKKVGSLGDVAIGEWFVGLKGVVSIEFREPCLDLAQKLMPWWSSGVINMSPAMSVDLYTYAQRLILHPREIAAGTLTNDLSFLKAVPHKPYQVNRDGNTPDVWALDFVLFPDLSKLATVGLVWGYVGDPPA